MKTIRLTILVLTATLLPIDRQSDAGSSSESSSKTNFVVILADDLGIGDVGAYRTLYQGEDTGPHAWHHTPNLNRLATQGVRCTRAYATGWCAPSRQVLLSGQWANRTNAYDHPWIGGQLRHAGYITGIVGKSHGVNPTKKVASSDVENIEFDDGFLFAGGARPYYLTEKDRFPIRQGTRQSDYHPRNGDYLTDMFTEQAVCFIEGNHDKPFLLYLAYTAPHDPFQGKPDDLKQLFPDVFGEMSDDEIRATSGKRDRAMSDRHFAAMVHALDRGVGRIMQTLKNQGVDENTVVLFTSDNGAIHGSNYPLTGHKWDGLEGGIRVPFIVWSKRLSESSRAGSLYDGLVSLADIAPTVMAEASDQASSAPTDGINLMPYLLGEQERPAGRRYFWANTSYSFHLSGVPGFDGKQHSEYKENIVQSVLIQDDEKVLAYQPHGTKLFGAVYARIPDAIGDTSPAETLKEKTPVAGKTPAKDTPLYSEFLDMIRSNSGEFVPQWSGQPTNYQWWLP